MLRHLNYTVILTYMNLLFGVLGIFTASNRYVVIPLTSLCLAGICDAFDGQIARMKRNRTERDKAFGIQIDSLADIVSFGLLPAFIAYNHSPHHAIFIPGAIYMLSAVTRLGYYNVLEGENLYTGNRPSRFFVGLPVTSVTVIMPILYLLPIPEETIMMFLVNSTFLIFMAILFVAPIRVPKPSKKMITALGIIGGISITALLFIQFSGLVI